MVGWPGYSQRTEAKEEELCDCEPPVSQGMTSQTPLGSGSRMDWKGGHWNQRPFCHLVI